MNIIKRGIHFSIVRSQRKTSWVLPEIKSLVQSSSPGVKKRNLKFASLNDGPSIPKNWRSMKDLPEWKRHKFALKEKFGDEGWNPRKKLSRDTIDQIKVINANYPQINAKVLANEFKMSPEAMRRILKSSFKPTVEQSEKILERWKRRGERHLKNKFINQITDQFIAEKQEQVSNSELVKVPSLEELRKIVAKKLTGKEDILKP